MPSAFTASPTPLESLRRPVLQLPYKRRLVLEQLESCNPNSWRRLDEVLAMSVLRYDRRRFRARPLDDLLAIARGSQPSENRDGLVARASGDELARSCTRTIAFVPQRRRTEGRAGRRRPRGAGRSFRMPRDGTRNGKPERYRIPQLRSIREWCSTSSACMTG